MEKRSDGQVFPGFIALMFYTLHHLILLMSILYLCTDAIYSQVAITNLIVNYHTMQIANNNRDVQHVASFVLVVPI